MEEVTEMRRIGSISVSLVLTAMLLATQGCAGVGDAPVASDGVIDLRAADLDHPVHLKGEWLAQPAVGHGIPLGDDWSEWTPVRLPGYFESHGFADDGTVWYRLHVRLPRAAQPLKGFIQHANNAHALYAVHPIRAPRMLASSGRASSDAEETVLSRAPVTFDLPLDTSIVLLWKVANFDYRHGGPFHAIQIGTVRGMERALVWKAFSVFALFGIYSIIMAGFLMYWWMHRSEVETLALGLTAGIMAIRTPVMAGALEYLFPQSGSFEVRILLEAITFLLIPGMLAWLLWAFFPRDMNPIRIGRLRILPDSHTVMPTAPDEQAATPAEDAPGGWRRFNTALIGTTICFSILTAFLALVTSSGTTSHVMGVARIVYLLIALGALVLLAQVVYRRRAMAVSIVSGSLLLIVAGAHDMLLSEGFFQGNIHLATYGFMGFVLTQSYALARRHAVYAQVATEHAEILRNEVSLRTKELRAASIAAQAANLAKSHFLSAVSHELRSPLASILGYTRILHEELENDLEPQHAEFFDTIRISGERLVSLVNDILDVAKIEAGMLDLNVTPVDVRALALEVVNQVYPLTQEKGLAVYRHFDEKDVLVLADSTRLRQVLLNLVSNAVKFTREGEITLSATETTLEGAPAFAISVTDTGPGISGDFLPHLFDRFTQEKRLYNETQRGTGLGLSISRELMTRMNGTIEVESAVGVGSTFTIVLPRAILDEEEQDFAKAEPAGLLDAPHVWPEGDAEPDLRSRV